MERAKAAVRLRDIAECHIGEKLSRDERLTHPGHVPVIGAGSEPVDFVDRGNTGAPVVTVAREGKAEAVSFFEREVFATNSVFYLKSDLPMEAVYVSLLAAKDRMRALMPSSPPRQLRKPDFESLEVAIPDLEASQKLVKSFLKLRETIEKEEQSLLAVKALFLEKHIEEGDIELKEVAYIKTGFPFKKEDFVHEGRPVIKGSCLEDGFAFVNEEKLAYTGKVLSEKYRARLGDTLVFLSGSVGKCSRCSHPAYLNQRVAALRTKSDSLLPDYLFRIVSSPVFKRWLDRHSYGEFISNVDAKDLGRFPVQVPSFKEQLYLVKTADKLDKLILSLRARRRFLEKIFEDRAYSLCCLSS